MKLKIKTAINFVILYLLFLSASCSSVNNMQNDLKSFHDFFLNNFESTISTVQNSGSQNIQELQKIFNDKQECFQNDMQSKISSIYIPKSSVKENRLYCTVKTVLNLENYWEKLYKKLGLLSWLYVYDHETKSFVIYPSTNTQLLYGDDLTFETFYFYKDAVANYPNGIWTGVRDDVNGTGKILIYSQAIKLSGNNKYTVLGIDMSLTKILDQYQSQILELSDKYNLNNVFIISYLKNKNKRHFVHEFSTNPKAFNTIYPMRWDLISMNQLGDKELSDLEATITKIPLKSMNIALSLADRKFYCGFGRIKSVNVYSLICAN